MLTHDRGMSSFVVIILNAPLKCINKFISPQQQDKCMPLQVCAQEPDQRVWPPALIGANHGLVTTKRLVYAFLRHPPQS